MIEYAKPIAEWCSVILESLGVVIITLNAFYALFIGATLVFKKVASETIFDKIRQRLGRGILLGLEFLIAADIIHTVVVEFTFETVIVLAIIILVRTFLSFTLHIELTGSWHWQNEK